MSGFRLQKLAAHVIARKVKDGPPPPYPFGGDLGQQLYEFGQREWCQALSDHGQRLLILAAEAGKLDLSRFEWGFSEEYTNCPERLLDRREAATWWIMVRKGKVSGGAGPIPGECLELPGFHIAEQWGLIAHPSGVIYDSEGQKKRMEDAKLLNESLIIECRPPPHSHEAIRARKPPFKGFDAAFPPEIGAALGDQYVSDLDGLHNFGAKIMKESPEVCFLPMTPLGVPKLQDMDDAQRAEFYHLLDRPLRPLFGGELARLGFMGMPGSMAGKWDFAQKEWCEACAEYGAQLLRAAAESGELDLKATNWAFSEEYTEVPSRLAYTDRGTTLYWFMAKDGVISSGAGLEIPADCLATPGFHIAAPWALIAGPSGGIYGPVGSALRNYHAGILNKQLKEAGKSSPPQASLDRVYKHKPPMMNPPFPPPISSALRDRPELQRVGLHNFAAYIGGKRSPELDGLPETTSFNVDLARCSAEQRQHFFRLLQR